MSDRAGWGGESATARERRQRGLGLGWGWVGVCTVDHELEATEDRSTLYLQAHRPLGGHRDSPSSHVCGCRAPSRRKHRPSINNRRLSRAELAAVLVEHTATGYKEVCWYVSQAFGDAVQRVGEAINDDEKERHGHFSMGI